MSQAAMDATVPRLLIQHLPTLIAVSQEFCNQLQEDPSAWGLSTAFIRVEDMLERAFVGYCEVVEAIMLACQQAGQRRDSLHSRPSSSSKRNNGGRSGSGSPVASEFGGDVERSPHNGNSPVNVGVPRSRSMPGGKVSRW